MGLGLGDLNPVRIVEGKGAIGESGLGSLVIGGVMASMGVPPSMIPYLVGGTAALATGDLGKGLMAGLGAAGGASMAGSAGFGAAGGLESLAPVSDAGTALQGSAAAAPTMSSMGSEAYESFQLPGGQANALNTTINADQAVQAAMPQTTTQLPSTTQTPATSAWDSTKNFVKENAWPLGIAAGASLLAQKPKGVDVPAMNPGYIRPYVYDPRTQGLQAITPVKAPGYAIGGVAEAAANVIPQRSSSEAMDYLMGRGPENAVGAPPTSSQQAMDYMMGKTSVSPSAAPQPTDQDKVLAGFNAAVGNTSTPAATAAPTTAPQGFYYMNPQGQMQYSAPQTTTTVPAAPVDVSNQDAGGGQATGGIVTLASGGPVEQMSNQNAIGSNTGYPMAYEHTSAFATPYQTPISQNVLSGPSDTNVDPYTGEERLAMGGIAGYAGGGLESLGGYSDGGRLLKGPGDGVSDSIPATIGQGQKPARLADGEFVVPARIVSELGNGSTEAGARQLYKMMDRVQAGRRKTTGKGKVAANTSAAKHLPA